MMRTEKQNMPGSKKARILIVDDHPMLREGLAARIGRQPDLEVCGEAADITEGLEQVKSTRPDLAIIDLSLKSGHGLELIKKIKHACRATKMLVCSMYDETLYAERVVRAGALSFINKQELPEKVLEAIRQVLAGKLYFSPATTEHLLQRAVGMSPGATETGMESLTNRELDVFRLIGQGKTSRQIAKDLHLSIKTVETHRENIKGKLGIETVAELSRQAVVWVMENG